MNRQNLFSHLKKIINENDPKDLDNIQVIEDFDVHSKKRRMLPAKMCQKEFRGSPYKGVTRNGRAWQVQTMIDGEHVYLGICEDPAKAAALYDMLMI